MTKHLFSVRAAWLIERRARRPHLPPKKKEKTKNEKLKKWKKPANSSDNGRPLGIFANQITSSFVASFVTNTNILLGTASSCDSLALYDLKKCTDLSHTFPTLRQRTSSKIVFRTFNSSFSLSHVWKWNVAWMGREKISACLVYWEWRTVRSCNKVRPLAFKPPLPPSPTIDSCNKTKLFIFPLLPYLISIGSTNLQNRMPLSAPISVVWAGHFALFLFLFF